MPSEVRSIFIFSAYLNTNVLSVGALVFAILALLLLQPKHRLNNKRYRINDFRIVKEYFRQKYKKCFDFCKNTNFFVI